MRKSWILRWLALVLMACATGAYAQSQATTGVIEGTVFDESGAPAPGASVVIKNTATNFERPLTTDNNGRFRGLLLPLGPYRITVTLQGFATLIREGIDLSVGQTVNLPLTLKVSTVQEQVVVTGDAPVVETTRAEGATKIDQESIRGLPNNGRNFLDFTKLTPGVTIVQGPDGDELSVNGQKGINNNVSVDGADFNNPFFGEQRGGQRPAFTFNLDAVKEIVVVAEGANAEFGRASSGFINVVTKSGTNDVHGSAHVFFKDQGLASAPNNPDGTQAPKFNFNQEQAGFTLGGPIQKDKLFYFVAFDAQRGRSTKQTDPNRIDPRLVAFFAGLGSPNENAPITRTNDARVALGKLDWQVSAQHLATLRYNFTWAEQQNGTFDVDSFGLSANGVEQSKSHAVSGSLISNFSSSLLNEFRFQVAREDRPRPYAGPNINGQSRPLPDTAIDFAGQYRFGDPFFLPVPSDYDVRIQFNDNVSILKGSHAIKMGVEFNHTKEHQTFLGFANGLFKFDSVQGFLSYAQNPHFVECSDGSSSQNGACPPGTNITGPVLLYLQQAGANGNTVAQAGTQDIPVSEPAIFIQDKWQPRRNLTIQYGLRWEAQIEPDPITPVSQVFYAPFIGKTVTPAGFSPQTFPSDGTIPSDYKMFQPRLGISWDPKGDGKTVIRLNGGIFYARVPGLNLASARSTNGSLGQGLAGASNFGVIPAFTDLIPQSQIGSPNHPQVYVFDKNFKNPRTYSGSISVEREVTADFSVLVQYNHAKGVHITRFINRNDALLGSPWSTGLGSDGTNGIDNGTGTGLTTTESSAKSLYDGVTLGVNKKWSKNFEFEANYTLSYDRSDDDNERDPFTYRYALVTNLAAEYGYSDRDQRHRFNGWLLWKAPGDFRFNLRYAFRSPQPQSLKANGTVANTPQDRINPDGTVTQRNLGRKDNQFSSFDFRVTRDFKAGGVTIQPIVEVFNLFNSVNLRKPGIGNLLFNFDGTIQSGLGDPRQMQLGLRVLF
jgi:hypothetical protein